MGFINGPAVPWFGMARGRRARDVVLSAPEREALEAVLRRPTAPQREVRRARIALLAAAGEASAAIAVAPGVSTATVCLWRGRVAQAGAMGVKEWPRPGRPPWI